MADPESVARSFDTEPAQLDTQVKWINAQRSPHSGEIKGVDAVVETVPGLIGRDFGNFGTATWTFSRKATGQQRSGSTRGAPP